MDAAAFEEYMRRNGASRSAVFAWMMNRVIAQVNDEPKEPIVAALAANARKACLSEKKESGYGIKLIHALVESFEYRRNMSLNNLIIHMKKERKHDED